MPSKTRLFDEDLSAIEESETEAAASGWRLIEVDLAVYPSGSDEALEHS
jgi:hypothetical protein